MEIDAIRIGAFRATSGNRQATRLGNDFSSAITNLETHWYWRPNTGEAEARLLADLKADNRSFRPSEQLWKLSRARGADSIRELRFQTCLLARELCPKPAG